MYHTQKSKCIVLTRSEKENRVDNQGVQWSIELSEDFSI